MSKRVMVLVLTGIATLSMTSLNIPAAKAAELKLLSAVGLRALLPAIMPQYEKSSGNKVTIELATVGQITDRVAKGDPADVAIMTIAQSEDLLAQGKLLAGSRSGLAKVGYGAFVKAGTPKPEFKDVEAFKRTLLAATAVAAGDPAGGGGSGVYFAGLFKKLDLAEPLKSKTKLLSSASVAAEAVAKGEVPIGLGLATDAVIIAGLVFVPLPSEIQSYTQYAAGVVATSKQGEAGKTLVAFLASPEAKKALAAAGFEPL